MSTALATSIPSLEKHVDDRTPPAFIFATANDAQVPVSNSLQFAVALDQARVPFELHIFRDGVHGLSLSRRHTSSGFKALDNPRVAVWVELSLDWLEDLLNAFPADHEIPEAAVTEGVIEYSVDVALWVCWANLECQRLILNCVDRIFSRGIRVRPALRTDTVRTMPT